MDSTDQIIQATERLIKKYESIIDKYELNGNKLLNFIQKRDPQYDQMVKDYLSCNS